MTQKPKTIEQLTVNFYKTLKQGSTKHKTIFGIKGLDGDTKIFTSNMATFYNILNIVKRQTVPTNTTAEITLFRSDNLDTIKRSLDTSLQNTPNAIFIQKPHLVNEATHEPIYGDISLILSGKPSKMSQYIEPIVETHLLPEKGDRDVENPIISNLYSIVTHMIVNNEDVSIPYGIYKQNSIQRTNAVESISKIIEQDLNERIIESRKRDSFNNNESDLNI